MSRTRKSNWLRYTFQLGVTALIILFITKAFGCETADPEAYCPFGGLETLATYFVKGSLACSMTMVQIMMGVILAVGAILFGKLFCSYICPLGFINEIFMRLRRTLHTKMFSIRNGGPADAFFRIIKYALLFLIFYMTLSSSELFCKNFDPYYALATGFKGELTVWMVSISLGVLFLGSLLVDMFWCRYICPLGAISHIFKFTLEFIIVALVFTILKLTGIDVTWMTILIAACTLGYLLEILFRRPKLNPQLLSVYREASICNGCGLCEKRCPHHIPLKDFDGKVTCVDCSLCGECVSSCSRDAITLTRKSWGRWIPGFIAAALFFIALWLGSTTELPTIDVKWNTTVDENGVENVTVPDDALVSFDMTGMRSVKCYGSSMAFKAKLQRIPGVYGVKTFVKHGRVTIFYDPSAVTPEKIQESVYTPTKFRISDPEEGTAQIKVITVRTENMYDKMDPNYLGMQFRNAGRRYYGLETEYACPLIVRLYMAVNEPIDEEFIKQMCSLKEVEMPQHGGGVKIIPVNYKYVRTEDQVDTLALRPYLEKMFTPFKAEFKTRVEKYAGRPQQTMSYSDMNYQKPLTLRNLPFLSNYLSQQEGIIGIYLLLNEENMPTIRVRFCTDDINPDKIMELVNQPKWPIKYKEGDVREESQRFKFTDTGKVEPYIE